MNLLPPNGFFFYGGADGIDAFPDANGYVWYADNLGKNSDDSYFQFHVMRTRNGVIEIMPLPEPINGSGRLNWTPGGLFVAGTTKKDAHSPVEGKLFQMVQFAQFTNNFPVIITNPGAAVSTVDTLARTTAMEALNTAKDAKVIGNNALNVANGKPSFDQVWQKINDRLYGLINAIESGNRADPLDARWQDVLFKKVNDWIYGWMKQHGFI